MVISNPIDMLVMQTMTTIQLNNMNIGEMETFVRKQAKKLKDKVSRDHFKTEMSKFIKIYVTSRSSNLT